MFLFWVGKDKNYIEKWMELLEPVTAKVLAYYDHPAWGKYAAVTENAYGKGVATYIGCLPSQAITEKILEHAVKDAGLWGPDQALKFPLIVKSGTNHYYFNYSAQPQQLVYPYQAGTFLLTGKKLPNNNTIELPAWGFDIVEED